MPFDHQTTADPSGSAICSSVRTGMCALVCGRNRLSNRNPESVAERRMHVLVHPAAANDQTGIASDHDADGQATAIQRVRSSIASFTDRIVSS